MTNKAPPKDPLLPSHFNDNVSLSLTINPDDNFQFTSKVGNQRFQSVRQHVMNDLLQYVEYIECLKLYPDISFPSPLGGGRYPRIHWHGFVTFKNILNFLTKFSSCSHFMYDIDSIDDDKYWKAYSKKFIKQYKTHQMYSISLKDIIDMKPRTNSPNKANILEMLQSK